MQDKYIYIDHALVLVTGKLVKATRNKDNAADMNRIIYGRVTKNMMGNQVETIKAKLEYVGPCIIPPGPKGKYITKLDDNQECVRALILRSAFSEFVAQNDPRRESIDSIGRRFSNIPKGLMRNTKTFLKHLGDQRVDTSIAKQHGISRIKIQQNLENMNGNDTRMGLLEEIQEEARTKIFERMTGIMEHYNEEDEMMELEEKEDDEERSEKVADL